MKRRRQEGFAMLLVFAMAAAVAILLYRELPRLVFESQRIKEQELINRGLEYRRAIQLYVRKNKRYPQSLDDLERGTGIRYLRRRYKDPMTGKSEWRLIHIDNAGVFTDSLIHKPKEEEKKKSENTFITEGAAFGSTGPAPDAGEGHTGAAVRGASDRPVVTAEQFQGQPQAADPFAPEGAAPVSVAPQGDPQAPPPVDPQQVAMPGYAPVQPYPQQPGQPQPFPVAVPQPVYPGQAPVGQAPPAPNPAVQIGIAPYVVPAQPAQVQISVPGQPPVQIPVNAPGAQPAPIAVVPQGAYPYPQQPVAVPPNPAMAVGVAPYVVPGSSPGQQPPGYSSRPGEPGYAPPAPAPPGMAPYPSQGIPGLPGPFGAGSRRGPAGPTTPSPAGPQAASPQGNPALQLIQQILTTPRPAGMQGAAAAPAGAMIPGGIAGVASTLEAESIMVFGERTKYNEWEFIYDFRQEQSAAAASAALGAGVGSQANPLGAPQPGESKPSLFGPPGQASPPSRFGATR